MLWITLKQEDIWMGKFVISFLFLRSGSKVGRRKEEDEGNLVAQNPGQFVISFLFLQRGSKVGRRWEGGGERGG